MAICLLPLLMTEFVDSAASPLATRLFPTTKWPRGKSQYLSQMELRTSEHLSQMNYMRHFEEKGIWSLILTVKMVKSQLVLVFLSMIHAFSTNVFSTANAVSFNCSESQGFSLFFRIDSPLNEIYDQCTCPFLTVLTYQIVR